MKYLFSFFCMFILICLAFLYLGRSFFLTYRFSYAACMSSFFWLLFFLVSPFGYFPWFLYVCSLH